MSAATQEDLVQAIIEQGIQDERVIDAFRQIPRAEFVPPGLVHRAYADEPLPIPHGQVTTQPSLTARMIEGLGLKGGEKVLEIGTGYGFQTALLSRLCRFVWSIERWTDTASKAQANLARIGIRNVDIVVGDGSEGLPSQAPFDGILVSAAFPEVPDSLAEQVRSGGRLVQPIGSGGDEQVKLFEREDGGLVYRSTLTLARFFKLYGRFGFPEAAE